MMKTIKLALVWGAFLGQAACATSQIRAYSSNQVEQDQKYRLLVDGAVFTVKGSALVPPFHEITWSRVPTSTDLAPIYSDEMSSEIQASLSCKGLDNGILRDCTVLEISPESAGNRDMMIIIASKLLRADKIPQPYLAALRDIGVSIRATNANGKPEAVNCLPAFCSIIPPPPSAPPLRQ